MAMAADSIFKPVSGIVALEELTKTIRADVPRSACIHNMILMHAKGYADFFNVYIQKESPDNILLVEKSDNGIISVYCPQPNEDEFLEALNKTTLISWKIFNCALYVPETIREKLSMLIIKRTRAEVFVKEGEFHIYDPEEETMELEIPADYTLRKLGHASAIQMEAVGEPLYVCPNLNKFRELHITAPNCTVYRTEGEPSQVINFSQNDLPEAVEEGISLAWACSNKEGQLGIVCTDEAEILKIVETMKDLDHMEKVLTHLVVNACTLRMVKEGFIVHSNIYHGLSEVPYMSNWRHVGYICSIYSRFSDSSTDDDRTGMDDDRTGMDDDRNVTGGYRLGTHDDLGGAGGDDSRKAGAVDLEESAAVGDQGGVSEIILEGAGETIVEGAGETIVEGAGEAIVEGAGEAIVEGAGEAIVEGAGEAIVEGAGEAIVEGAGEEILEGAGEVKLRGTDVEEQCRSDDEKQCRSDDEKQCRSEDEEQRRSDDEEQCGPDDEEEEEPEGTDVGARDTDVELVETEKDIKEASHKEADDAD